MADRPFGSMAPSPVVPAAPTLMDKLSRTWPVEVLRAAIAAAALPGDVYAGRTPMTLGTVSDDPAAPDFVGNAGPTGQVINPDVIRRSADLAGTVMSGGGAAGGAVSHAGETALGIVPVDVARAFKGVSSSLPESDLFQQAVKNTPGAMIDNDVVRLAVTRNQHPDQAMQDSLRGGVFYLPDGSKDAKYYTGTGHNFSYGGTETVSGETAFKNPLFVKGATGGKAPEAAFDALNGKGAYQQMRTDALRSAGGYGLTPDLKEELIRQFLDKHAPEMSDLSWHIMQNTNKGNQLAYALQEAAVASAARKAGHDGVIGYSMGRKVKEPRISEVFDVRERSYPDATGGFETWPDTSFGSLAPKQR